MASRAAAVLIAVLALGATAYSQDRDFQAPSFAPCTGAHTCREQLADAITRRWTHTSAHPLVAKVYRIGPDKDELEPVNRLAGIAGLRYLDSKDRYAIVLLGDVHDNPEHHWFRARVVPAELGQGLPPSPVALVFEQFRSDQQPALDRFMARRTTSPASATLEELKRSGDWSGSGGSKYSYDPLLERIVGPHSLAVCGGDAPGDVVRRAAREGEVALSSGERTRFALDTPLGGRLDASLTEIEGAHCGMVPKAAFGNMAFAQRYRDAHLADATLQATEKHGSAILIAGNGHVRTDRGVPWYIRQRATGQKVVAVMLVEVEGGKTDPEAYVPRDPDGNPAADYLIFTPRAGRSDPCGGMRKEAN